MTDLGDRLAGWFSGVPQAPSGLRPAAAVVVTRGAGLPSTIVRADDLLLVTDPGVELPGSLPLRGEIDAAEGCLELPDGARLLLRPYGTAEFLDLAEPTVLTMTAAEDVSAFLRDADEAWHTGRFASALHRGTVTVAQLAGLGGGAELAGPDHRLLVEQDGSVRTSSLGPVIGAVQDPRDDLARSWSQRNTASLHPDAASLDLVVDEGDRVQALAERPWLARLLQVAGVLRRFGAPVTAVSGIGGRLVEEQVPDLADPLGAPVLLQLRDRYLAHDPHSSTTVPLTADAVGVVETALYRRRTGEVDAPAPELRMLALAGVSPRWCLGSPLGATPARPSVR